MWPTGTAHPIEFYLDNYEQTGDPHRRIGGLVELTDASSGDDPAALVRVIEEFASMSPKEASAVVDLARTEKPPRIDVGSPERARAFCTRLFELGFAAYQVPEPLRE